WRNRGALCHGVLHDAGVVAIRKEQLQKAPCHDEWRGVFLENTILPIKAYNFLFFSYEKNSPNLFVPWICICSTGKY
ncbi:MAG: hypothetical protein MJZ22_04360, partial [Candidatus Saccharibacteria bacterium]|nr:hypothetical protein [Candidatus Saccharibacteria bacterium]